MRLREQRKSPPPRPTIITPAPEPELDPIDDILEELVMAPAAYIRRMRTLRISNYKRVLLLSLAERSQTELINDITANWYIVHTGHSPLSDHDYIPIPDQYLPQCTTVEEFESYLNDFRKRYEGITPSKTIYTTYRPNFTVNDPMITEHSTVTIEVDPTIVTIENGKLTFDLIPNGHKNILVKVKNP